MIGTQSYYWLTQRSMRSAAFFRDTMQSSVKTAGLNITWYYTHYLNDKGGMLNYSRPLLILSIRRTMSSTYFSWFYNNVAPV